MLIHKPKAVKFINVFLALFEFRDLGEGFCTWRCSIEKNKW